MSAQAAELVLRGGLEEVPRSRDFTRRATGSHLDPVTDDVAIVVTELVTNALLHSGPPVRLRLLELAEGVRLEVADHGAEVPVAGQRSSVAMTGRGLALVAALTRSWGVEADERGGKTVWAELVDGAVGDGGAVLAGLDADRLLDASADDSDATEPLHTVVLAAVPTDLLLDAKAHVDDLVREFTSEPPRPTRAPRRRAGACRVSSPSWSRRSCTGSAPSATPSSARRSSRRDATSPRCT